MQLIGFIIRIYHDARSPERQISYLTFIPIISCIIPFLSWLIFLTFVILLSYLFPLFVFITENTNHVLFSHIMPTPINVPQKSQKKL